MNLEFVSPLTWGVPCFVVCVLVELAYSKTHDNKSLYNWKDLTTSSAMGLGAGLLATLLKFASGAAIFYGVFELFNPEINGVRTNIMGFETFGWGIGVWLLCQLLDDFSYYWLHRFNHTVRFLWAAHIVHHSSDHYNLGTGLRNGWFTVLYKPFFYMWIPALGFHPEMLLVCMGIESFWQFQLHTTYIKRLGFLEKFMNTHTQHQVHHAQNVEYLDKNHGGYLNLFDKIFGTWKDYDPNVDVKYGVIHAPDSNNPLVVVSHEYQDIWRDVKSSKNVYQAFMYVFGEPGWSPDGSTLTVKQMQKELDS